MNSIKYKLQTPVAGNARPLATTKTTEQYKAKYNAINRKRISSVGEEVIEALRNGISGWELYQRYGISTARGIVKAWEEGIEWSPGGSNGSGHVQAMGGSGHWLGRPRPAGHGGGRDGSGRKAVGVSIEEILEQIAMWKGKKSMAGVAKGMGISKATMYRILKKGEGG